MRGKESCEGKWGREEVRTREKEEIMKYPQICSVAYSFYILQHGMETLQ